MKLSSLVRPIALAAMAGGLTLGAPSAQAGLFDFLFGGGQRPAPQYYQPGPGYGQPLDVRVNPSKRKQQGAAKVRPGKERTTKVVNRAIDPKKHPNWYLEDPTLKRGDIVVLPTGVMVYEGGAKPQVKEDFARLSESRMLSKKERERILQMAGPESSTIETPDPTKGKEASGPTNPVQ